MRILVVSLLRLGDVLLTAPALAGLRRKFPSAQIDLLINRSSWGAYELLQGIDECHAFEREQLQMGLGEAEIPLFEPFFRLEKQVLELAGKRYDLILNLTHNRLSGWLCGAIGGGQILGLSLDAQAKPQFGSIWFQYLNDRAESRGREIFHYSDIFWFGSGLSDHRGNWSFRRTESGQREAEALFDSDEPFILVQTLTSEEKKSWGMERWRHALNIFQKRHPAHHILLLGAATESERIEALAVQLRTEGVRAKSAICSLPGVLSLLDRAELLITGDTSIKHLASATRCPVVELSLGSSDWRRTGTYKPGAIILQPEVQCAPCPHSSPCDQAEHLCARQLAPDVVAAVASAVLENDGEELSQIARDQRHRMGIFKTDFSGAGYWQALDLGRTLAASDLREWLDKLTTKLILEGLHLQALAPYGSEAARLGYWLRERFPQLSLPKWRDLIQAVDGETVEQSFEATDAGKRLGSLIQESRARPLVELREMRQLQVKMADVNQRLEIRRRLVRSLKDVVEESL